MNEQELKQKLKADPDVTLTDEMLAHIGSPDPELRDGLIYPQFVNFILENQYSNKQIELILKQCLEKLTSDNVFERSFSVLVIAVILHKYEFDTQKLSNITKSLCLYIKEEQDIRGYIEGKGWAHSIAHGADAILELSKQPDLAQTDLEDLFNALNEKMKVDQSVFSADEDERVAFAVNTMLGNGLNNEVFTKAIQQVTTNLVDQLAKGRQAYFNSRMNYKAFLRSLYFILKAKGCDEELDDFLERKIIELSQIYYCSEQTDNI